ncbi:MAG: hypothetical protein DRG78_03110 [Epsilonproteobacteria bacterium]|nr:MAG: hypothetical protein DRG78_03110 [Campylobacterota bacterium]
MNILRLLRNIINYFGFDISKFDTSLLDDKRFYKSYHSDSLLNKVFYNIGAGDFKHQYWTNIDYETNHYKNVQSKNMIHHDLMELSDIPLESNSAEVFYSSHTIEHISNEAVQKMVSECYRILKSNGVIRLTTPNFQLYYDAYKRNDILMWDWDINRYSKKRKFEKYYTKAFDKFSIEQIFLYQFASQLSQITKDNSTKKYSDNEIKEIFNTYSMDDAFDYFIGKCKFNSTYPGNHINWYTKDKLIKILKDAGFKDIRISSFGQSYHIPLRNKLYFDNTHPSYSIYIEAVK